MPSSYNSPRNQIAVFHRLIKIYFGFGGYEMQNIVNFFREVGREMRKVSWPKRKALTNYTITVLATVAFFAVFFAVIDLGISELIRIVVE